ncbi:hypothetical protein QAD02_012085 [Eretmocerus hayati]|uniref:Uncharacterized protein n=1 Tax=Eretmocerus hayati TaxID=131215 RepID=A0ACC2NYL4_9HYME|nr:hypothetical protein QAD02_012085 [Eretmocerus hayati]
MDNIRLALFVTLLNLIACTKTIEVKSVSKISDFRPSTQLFDAAVHETSIWYISCEESKKLKKSCSVVYENHSLKKTKSIKKCSFSPDVEVVDHALLANIYPINEDAAIIAWSESDRKSSELKILKLITVKFSDCSTSSLSIHRDSLKYDPESAPVINVFMEDGNYLISFENKTLCDKLCVETFDSKGRSVKGPVNINAEVIGKSSLVLQDPLVSESLHSCIRVLTQERLNSSLIFDEKLSKISYKDLILGAGVSTANGKLGFCKREKSQKTSFRCFQGDTKKWINLSFNYEPTNMLMYNLPEGGYLLLTSEKGDSVQERNQGQLIFYLTKFDANGQRQGSAEIMRRGCHARYVKEDSILGQIFEDENDNYCVSSLSIARQFEFVLKCVRKEDLNQ